ncbi:MAG: AarF/ABC1/UbiB kinase family protein, partial [Bdellovibrionales bacterium]
MVSVDGMGRLLLKDFDFLTYSLEFAKDLVQVRMDPKRMFSDASVLARDMNSLAAALPRQTKQMLRRLNDPDFSLQIRSAELTSLRRSVDRGSWRIFWGLIFAAAVLGLILRY